MNVYPLNIHLGPIEFTGYGVMMAVGFLMAGWSIQLWLKDRSLNPEYAFDMVMWAVVGGILGAKLWYVALTGNPRAFFSRAGLVWYGGFLGGAAAVLLNGWRRRVPIQLTAELAAPALALGYALGRVGCFMVGDDYGRPTTLPWGVRFPEGLPPSTGNALQEQFGIALPPGALPTDVLTVHPTQLYEVTVMFTVFAVLWRLRRHQHAMGWLFGLYLALAGTERLLIEFLRAKDDRFLGPLTLSQATSVVLALTGAWLMTRLSDPSRVRAVDTAALAPRAAAAEPARNRSPKREKAPERP